MASEAPVTLREITKDTLRSILALKVHPEQEKLVAPNAVSIAQAYFHDEAWFRAIYAGDEPVGFAMLEILPEKPFLWRFMLGADHQRKGYGRRAIELLCDHVRTLPGATEIETSHVPADGNPGPFYEKCGFVYTGEEEDGERIMRRPL